MAHRSIEEVIQTIAPRRGTARRPTIAVGTSSTGTSANGDLAASLSQAGQQIAQLQSAYQQQASLITQNTQALQSNTSAKSGNSAGSVLGGVASNLFGGALGFLSPIVSGIASLFGGNTTPQALPVYRAPSPISISGILQTAPAQSPASTGSPQQPQPSSPAAGTSTGGGNQTTYSPQITVNVSAMDSQSFLDRSNDIASAVREAMLNMHPINNVVADL